MNSKEALETLGNVEVAVTTIKSGRTHIKTLKQQYETEFEVLERELLIKKELKIFDVYQEHLDKFEKDLKVWKKHNEQLEKENKELEEHSTELFDRCALLTLKVEELKKGNQELKEKVDELEQAIKILKDWIRFKVTKFNNLDGTFRYVLEYKVGLSDYGIILTEKQYELLKEVFENDR